MERLSARSELLLFSGRLLRLFGRSLFGSGLFHYFLPPLAGLDLAFEAGAFVAGLAFVAFFMGVVVLF